MNCSSLLRVNLFLSTVIRACRDKSNSWTHLLSLFSPYSPPTTHKGLVNLYRDVCSLCAGICMCVCVCVCVCVCDRSGQDYTSDTCYLCTARWMFRGGTRLVTHVTFVLQDDCWGVELELWPLYCTYLTWQCHKLCTAKEEWRNRLADDEEMKWVKSLVIVTNQWSSFMEMEISWYANNTEDISFTGISLYVFSSTINYFLHFLPTDWHFVRGCLVLRLLINWTLS